MLTTLPNLLTLSRIVAMPLVVATFYLEAPTGPWIGCALFALAGFTDWLDGRLARAWNWLTTMPSSSSPSLWSAR